MDALSTAFSRVIPDVDVILPCLDESAAIPGVLARMPLGWRAIVVDNGSTDDSAAVAAGAGALVVGEPRRGYGAAVHAGLLAATAPVVAVVDCDGSIDPAALVPLAAEVAAGRVDLAVGRRRPTTAGAWPWHARWGNRLLAELLRRRTGVPVRDLAPVRMARRVELLSLGVSDRRSGYPVETLLRAQAAGWRVAEYSIPYAPRHPGTRSKVSGSLAGTATAVRDMWTVIRRHRTAPPAPWNTPS